METDVDIIISGALHLASSRRARLRLLVLRGTTCVDVREVRDALEAAGHPDVDVSWERDEQRLRIAAAAFHPVRV